MKIKPGHIVKNLSPEEPVKILDVKLLGSMYSISFVGLSSKRTDEKIVYLEEIETLEILSEEGQFSFRGDPIEFKLFAEAERIRSAYMYDPLFAVNYSIVDPLPHQIEAVYRHACSHGRSSSDKG